MSAELRGLGVALGIAIGRAHLVAPSELEVKQYHIQRGDVLHEVARLNNAFSLVRAELEDLRGAVSAEAPGEVKAFLDLHRMILDDSLLCDAPRDMAPADVLALKERAGVNLAGLVLEAGGMTSHTTILARSLGLPAVVGAGEAREMIAEGDL